MKAALETLGFGSAYHMTEVFTHPEHARFWEAAQREERVDWEGFFSGYGVAVDWPACAFYAELMEAFPEGWPSPSSASSPRASRASPAWRTK